MRGDAFGARGDLVPSGATFRARGEMTCDVARREFVIEKRAELTFV